MTYREGGLYLNQQSIVLEAGITPILHQINSSLRRIFQYFPPDMTIDCNMKNKRRHYIIYEQLYLTPG